MHHSEARPLPRRTPLVIAHRGASALQPENTLAAYRKAVEEGADSIEGDLVVTKDGHLVARHEGELSATTDVAAHPEFAAKRATKPVDGTQRTGWFVEDFTLAEIKTLRALTRHGPGNPAPSKPPGSAAKPHQTGGVEPDLTVPTLTEMIQFVQSAGIGRHRPVVLYVELKDPEYYAARNLPEEPRLIEALREASLAGKDAPVFVESFNAASLRQVHQQIAVPLIQLYWAGTPGDGVTSVQALRDIAGYAAGIGVQRVRLRLPNKAETDPDGLDRTMVEDAHRAGLEVHVYTFDDTNAPNTPNEPAAVYWAYYAIGVDGVFTNKPDNARAARDTRSPAPSRTTSPGSSTGASAPSGLATNAGPGRSAGPGSSSGGTR